MINELSNKYTPELITSLEPNQIIIFGSNVSGIHGAGLAKYCKNNFGAVQGQALGITGQCYAIPTKDTRIRTLPLQDIQYYVNIFIAYAYQHRELEFLVTKIGCGLAGYTIEDIAPMFKRVTTNLILPEEFVKFNKKDEVIHT